MAITYVGGQSTVVTVTTPTTQTINFALTGGLASTPSAGDLVVVSYSEASGTDNAISGRISTSGYTFMTELYANDTYDSNLAVFRKFMGSTPDSSIVVIGATGTASGVTVNIAVFRGVDTTTPLDATTTTATGIDTGNVNPPAITPVTGGNVLVIFGTAASQNGATSLFSGPAYMTDFRQSARSGTSYRGVSGSGYVTGQAANVSYDPAAWTISSDATSKSWAAVTVALRPIGASYIDAAATSSATSSVTAAAAITAAGAVTSSSTVTTTADATVTSVYVDAAATASVSSSVTAAPLIVSTVSVQVDVTSSTTADAVVVIDAAAAAASATTVSAGAVAIFGGSASAEVASSATASASIIAVVSAEASAASAATVAVTAILSSSASSLTYATITAYAAKLWEVDAPDSAVWSPQSAETDPWTPTSSATEPWTPSE